MKLVTLKSQLGTLRSFLHFAANIDAVPEDLAEQIHLPNMTNGDDVSDSTLRPERVIEILDYLEGAQPGSRDHITLMLLW
ncbi:MAG: hypothetical protein V5A32_04145 [Halovenus sp.]